MSQTLILHAPASIGTIRTLHEGTIKAELYISKELPAAEMTALFQLAKAGEGWFVFSPNPIDEADIPKEKAEARYDGKTPSQRLYNLLYVRWRELTDKRKPFDLYYQEQMNKIMDVLKQDLPDRP